MITKYKSRDRTIVGVFKDTERESRESAEHNMSSL